jgi:hypothetical protein
MLRVLLLLALTASSMAAGFAFGLDGVQDWIGISGAVQGATLIALVTEQ